MSDDEQNRKAPIEVVEKKVSDSSDSGSSSSSSSSGSDSEEENVTKEQPMDQSKDTKEVEPKETLLVGTKRDHESINSNAVEEEEEEDAGWIGPLPTEAAPTKKRKGKLTQF